ncbi:response regulator transcription factor [Sphingomonas sp. ID1715]|uniref:response regulator FixJ n=1 Tax=Sphingomonas sp. ID1715 TaxID=1656898 RepID=UPI0014881DC8|nr:response regulator FixJ [Sphingomonas sp. ID1715]NNM76442.1 response regulator transcription factor [Sphingomonas sp. ID1715]
MTEKQVYIVDDDEAIRRSLNFMLRTSGYKVEQFTCGEEFLKAATKLSPGCVLLDIRMPGLDGLEVQQAMAREGVTLPVVIMTGHGDVNLAVRAMKAGAIDFIEKPFEKATLMSALDQGFARLGEDDVRKLRAQEAATRLEVLTPRERDVLRGLVEGLPNKTIAYDLGISPRTVEIHRANLMTKLNVKSLSEALRIAFTAGLGVVEA